MDEHFFTGYHTNIIRPDEILKSITIPFSLKVYKNLYLLFRDDLYSISTFIQTMQWYCEGIEGRACFSFLLTPRNIMLRCLHCSQISYAPVATFTTNIVYYRLAVSNRNSNDFHESVLTELTTIGAISRKG